MQYLSNYYREIDKDKYSQEMANCELAIFDLLESPQVQKVMEKAVEMEAAKRINQWFE